MQTFRKYVFLFLMVFVCFFLQSTLMPKIRMGSVMPNLMIIVTAASGFIYGRREGIFSGFLSGIMMDIFFESPLSIGAYALILVCIGYACASVKERVYEESRWLPYAFIAGSDLVYGIINFICFFMLRKRFSFGYYLGHLIIPEIIYTMILSLALYPLIRTIVRKLDEYERRRADKFV